jgi:ClpP class serine protease
MNDVPGMPRTRPQAVGDLMGGQVLALDRDLAAGLLALPVAVQPQAAVPGQDERGYQVVRGVANIGLRGILTPNYEFARWMGWTTYHGLAAVCAELAAAEDVAAVAVNADSPGGLVLGVEAAAEALAQLAAVKPVHVLVNPLAASAAYWIAAGATEIVLTPGSMVGSIGVGLQTYSFVAPSQIYGEQWFTMTSTLARAKWPDASTPEGKIELQRSLDETEAKFHAAVAAGRGIPLADLPARLTVTGDPRDGGAVFSGQDAITRGLADRIETPQAFYDRLLAAHGGKPAQAKPRARANATLAMAQAALARLTSD